MVLFIMLYKVVLTFESVDETLKCDHSNEKKKKKKKMSSIFLSCYSFSFLLNLRRKFKKTCLYFVKGLTI